MMILERKHQDFITTVGLLLNSFSLAFLQDSLWVNQQHFRIPFCNWLQPRAPTAVAHGGPQVSCLLYIDTLRPEQLPCLYIRCCGV